MALVLPFFRILTFLHFVPVLDNRVFSRRIKIGTAMALAIIITPMLPNNVVLNELLSVRSILLIGEQLLWGFFFAMALQLVFVALQTAGNILSMNMGLGMAMTSGFPGSQDWPHSDWPSCKGVRPFPIPWPCAA